MPIDTLTIAVNGEVSLGEFSSAVSAFKSLVDALSNEIARDASIDWFIDDLSASSAVATIRGFSTEQAAVERVVTAYGVVGRSLERGEPIPYSERVQREATNIARVIDGRITSIRFETPQVEATVTGATAKGLPSPQLRYSFGTIKGLVQTLSSRGALRFTVYDNLFDRAVSCYLKEGQEEIMRGAWGNLVVVEGKVGREPDKGRPVVVRDIEDVRIIDRPEPGSYRKARGVLKREADADEMPEDTIRRLRDE